MFHQPLMDTSECPLCDLWLVLSQDSETEPVQARGASCRRLGTPAVRGLVMITYVLSNTLYVLFQKN